MLEVIVLRVDIISLLKLEPTGNNIITEEGELCDLDDEVADHIEVGRDLN